MVEEEDGEEFVIDIVNDIVQSTLDVIYDKYIQQQTLPYTVDAARDMILQFVEVQYYLILKGKKIDLYVSIILQAIKSDTTKN